MNRIVTFAVVGFLTLASDSEAQEARKVPEPTVSITEHTVPGKFMLRDDGAIVFAPVNSDGAFVFAPVNSDGAFVFAPVNSDGTISARPFSAPYPPYLSAPNPAAVPKLSYVDPQLRDLVAKQTQLITSLSSSIQELQRTVEEIRTSSQDETTQLKKQLTLTDTRLKTLETKTGGN